MSRQANPAAIGLFVIGAFAIALGGLVFFGSGKLFMPKERFILYFEDSVHGLDEGAAVKFKGVPVGTVDQILIHFNQPRNSSHIPVIIQVDRKKIMESLGNKSGHWDQELFERQIAHGLRGRLELQSIITGILVIALDYFEDVDAPRFIQEKYAYREIPTKPSAFSDLGKDLSQTLEALSHVNFRHLFNDIQALIENANKKLSALDVEGLNRSIIGMTQAIEDRMRSELLTQVLTEARNCLKSGQSLFDEALVQIKPLSAQLDTSAQRFTQTLEQVDSTLKLYSELVLPSNAEHLPLQSTLDEISSAARAIRELADYLERNPNALLTGKAKQTPP